MKLITVIKDLLFPNNLDRKVRLLKMNGFKVNKVCLRYELDNDFFGFQAVVLSSYKNVKDFIWQARGICKEEASERNKNKSEA